MTRGKGRDRLIRFWVSEAERERWKAAAAADRRTLSDWLRLAAEEKNGEGSRAPCTVDVPRRGEAS